MNEKINVKKINSESLEIKVGDQRKQIIVPMNTTKYDNFIGSMTYSKETNKYGYGELLIGTTRCCSGHLLKYRISTKTDLDVDLMDAVSLDFNVYSILPVEDEKILVSGAGCNGNGVRLITKYKGVNSIEEIVPTTGIDCNTRVMRLHGLHDEIVEMIEIEAFNQFRIEDITERVVKEGIDITKLKEELDAYSIINRNRLYKI
ncbi:hypothetical protein H6503_02320 [Candidatus Woesearchaeota archaeon]|nr:hypothetical protein [Candidatus Woesearchaeota archaeon]